MYIVPDTIIKFMNVNLDPTYQHTIYFSSKTAQTNYFLSKAEITREDKYFQRYTRNSLIIDVPVQNMYDKNYMMFQNGGFSNKWFYAFILNVEWKSLTSCIISYQLDVLQTWYFDFTIHPSFVLREHSSTDVAGDNIVPEPISADIQYINGVSEQPIAVDKLFVLASMRKLADDSFETNFSTDSRSGMVQCYSPELVSSLSAAENFVNDFLDGHEDSILGIAPRLNEAQVSLSRPTQINGYIPRNKKLLTGQFCRYTFELGGNVMEVPLDVVPNPTVTSAPNNMILGNIEQTEYRAWLSNYGNANYPTSMSLAIPVQISKWAYNDYANTVALQSDATSKMLARENVEYQRDYINSYTNMVTGIWSGLGNILNPAKTAINPAGSAIGTVQGFQQGVNAGISGFELEANIDKHSEAISRHRANMQASATGASVNTMELMKKQQFYLSGYVWTVLRQDAERIDKYFDMYGYAVNQLKQPNFTARPHWNYIQTSGLEVTAQCPTGDMEFIKQIFNNGITFWKDGDEIGDYSLDNSLS